MNTRVIKYRGQKSHIINIGGITRELPVVQVSEGLWIASNADLILGDVEFIQVAAELIYNKVKQYNPEILVTPEAKAIAFAYELAKRLGHRRLVIARKSVKAYMTEYLIEECSSITTKAKQILVLVKEDADRIRDMRVCIVDDVVSTGETMTALERLVKRVGGIVVCKAAIWIEGPWYKGDLIYLDELPVFMATKGT
ncbi:MAG: phosphoribosyltransferase [Thermoproteota archaeon]|jgi:adenine phosphoribosyltransferase|nr:MAG: phosphoribosyltransferase [Candidatus Korarchaeota archaeon]